MEDSTIDEKRVYSEQTETTSLFVGTELGAARVDVSGDVIGEFSLLRRGAVHDLAAAAGRLVVAAEDVLVGPPKSLKATDFGEADAVGAAPTVAAGDGVFRYGDRWERTCDRSDVRAVDGRLLATEGGVYRLDGSHLGLADAVDVAADGPYVATESGLYRLGNGWMQVLEAPVTTVSAADGRAHAATPDTLYERRDEEWVPVEIPVDEAVVALAHGPATYAVTESGTLLVDAGDGWRFRSLGVSGVEALAVC
ncbi:MAG: hypothetical protein PPP58_07420 [Natronomonas sp.]